MNLPPTHALGIDISRHQGNLDWLPISKSNLRFVYIRSTMGASGVDERWKFYRAGARAAKLLDGVYHYFVPSQTPEGQLGNLVAEIGEDYGDLPIVVDVERGSLTDLRKESTTYALERLLSLIEWRYQHRPIIYTSRQEWEAMTTLPLWAKDYDFFAAQYNSVLTELHPSWGPVVAWQYAVETDELGRLDRDRWLLGSEPDPNPTNHPLALLKNQQVINLFYRAAGAQSWNWLTRAGLQNIFQQRQQPYSGPALDQLNLAEAEKARLRANL